MAENMNAGVMRIEGFSHKFETNVIWKIYGEIFTAFDVIYASDQFKHLC